MKLGDIDRAVVKNFRNNLFDQDYAGATINHSLSVIKTILEAAEEQNLIRGIPKIDRAANNTKHKGILTIEEVRKLFETKWSNYRAYTASLLAASTGLRLGEILGLVLSDYYPEGKYIHCRRSWDQALRRLNPTTKTGRARNVFIPQPVVEALNLLIKTNPCPMTAESFIFYADKSSAYPTEPKIITENFYKTMALIGISEESRKLRNISFHSHRHFLNSLLINANIPLQKIQSITGHLTAEMSQHYYHLDDMKDVQMVQEELFSSGPMAPPLKKEIIIDNTAQRRYI
jgi:integrase